MNIQFFVDVLERIPSGIWGVLFGSFISLLGVILTNRQNLKQLTLKFEQDREIRRAEREHVMFQKIYLKASEVIADRLTLIMKLSDLRIPDNELFLNPERNENPIAQAHLVSNGSAHEAIAKFDVAVGSKILQLMIKRSSLGLKQQQINFLDRKINELIEKFQIINDKMSAVNLDGGDKRKINILQSEFDFFKSEFDNAMAKKEGLQEELYKKQFLFLEECFEESVVVSEAAANAIYEMRLVLGINSDKKLIIDGIRENSNQIRSAMRDFLLGAKTIINENNNITRW